MKKTQIIKTITFLLILAVTFVAVTQIFIPKWVTGTSVTLVSDGLYEQKEDTIDVCVLGSSQLVYGISCMRLLEEYGISAYSCATGEQPLLCAYFYLLETHKNQNISTVILDTSMLYEVEEESRFRKTLDSAPFSMNKLAVIRERTRSEESSSFISYLFPIINYHGRWDELGKADLGYITAESEVYRGNILSSNVKRNVSYEKLCVDEDPVDESIQMDENQLRAFEMIVDYCKKENIELLLVKAPKGTWVGTKTVGCQELAKEHGLVYIDFNTAEMISELDLDVTRDFWNDDHLNVRGADKFTDYIGNYLLQTGEYEDFRNSPDYDPQLAADYKREHETKYLQSTYDVDEYLSLWNNERYEVVIQKTGEITEGWNAELQKSLAAYGVEQSWAELEDQNYVVHLRNGKVVAEQTAAEPIEDQMDLANNRKCNVKSDITLGTGDVKMKAVKQNIAFEQKGMNVLVYDSRKDMIVDSATIYYNKDKQALDIKKPVVDTGVVE